MTTTALIVELIVIGFQVLCWLSMIVALTSGLDWVNLDKLEKFATPLVVVGIGLAYTVGLIFDAFAALLEEKAIWYREPLEARRKRLELRQALRLKDPDLSRELDREHYFFRLVRSTAFNLALIALFGSILIWKANGLGLVERVTYVSMLIGVAVIGIYAWTRRRKNFLENREALYAAALQKSRRKVSRTRQKKM